MIGDQIIPTERTTPESFELQQLLRRDGATPGCHACGDGGLLPCSWRWTGSRDCTLHVGAFTNLTEDHLDFHKTMDDYAEDQGPAVLNTATRRLFNADDPYAAADAGPRGLPGLTRRQNTARGDAAGAECQSAR